MLELPSCVLTLVGNMKGCMHVRHLYPAGALEYASYNISMHWLMRMARWTWSTTWLLKSSIRSRCTGWKNGGWTRHDSYMVDMGCGMGAMPPSHTWTPSFDSPPGLVSTTLHVAFPLYCSMAASSPSDPSCCPFVFSFSMLEKCSMRPASYDSNTSGISSSM